MERFPTRSIEFFINRHTKSATYALTSLDLRSGSRLWTGLRRSTPVHKNGCVGKTIQEKIGPYTRNGSNEESGFPFFICSGASICWMC